MSDEAAETLDRLLSEEIDACDYEAARPETRTYIDQLESIRPELRIQLGA